ncbi:hypothetical protein PQU95_00495 [Vogesella sp. DC21W]|uniref:3-phosphoshikimate 1-carboxyvinyltransferase n=1 Tax=Vogesella aquatica TaxID=2984206 RepID=A0ABT5IT60_9NEIS|nr:hypothetical protein [Vogesella aquatica]MDC7715697.1 hypothetical protein [Vogesella aquatica]
MPTPTTLPPSDIRRDPSIQHLLGRMPQDVADTFTEAQLASLRLALGARSWGRHAVDIRGTVVFWRWRYYYVFLLGRNRRELTRREKQLSLLLQAVFLSVLLLVSTLLGLLVLYLVKSALGIDLFPGFSLGIWSWFKQQF